jgi:MraZ protein
VSHFIGTYRHTVDRKGRMSIPTQMVAGLAHSADGTFVIVPGPEGCLDAYPRDEWSRRVQVLRSISGGRAGRRYKRVILGEARECKVDGHNRILVPQEILSRAGISNSVLIVGQLDHLEIWQPKAFQAYLAAQTTTIEDVIEEIDARLEKRRIDESDR